MGGIITHLEARLAEGNPVQVVDGKIDRKESEKKISANFLK